MNHEGSKKRSFTKEFFGINQAGDFTANSILLFGRKSIVNDKFRNTNQAYNKEFIDKYNVFWDEVLELQTVSIIEFVSDISEVLLHKKPEGIFLGAFGLKVKFDRHTTSISMYADHIASDSTLHFYCVLSQYIIHVIAEENNYNL